MSIYQIKQGEYQKGDKVFIYCTDSVGLSVYEEATVLRALKTKTTVMRKSGVLPEAPIETLEIKNKQPYRLNCWFIAEFCEQNEKILFDQLVAIQRVKDEREKEAKDRLERSQTRLKDRVKDYKERFPLPKEDHTIRTTPLPDGSCLYQKIFDSNCLPVHLRRGNSKQGFVVVIHLWKTDELNFRSMDKEPIASAAYTSKYIGNRSSWTIYGSSQAKNYYLEKDDHEGLLLHILAEMYSEFVQNFHFSE